ncbi:MAG: hypothetical protein IPH69_00605 [Bacteroidales bacterium]|nr:hypothetical protein [Bacteroidales bacterium]MBK7629041.1 hypothetical protein [Bacteroidales bacterium]
MRKRKDTGFLLFLVLSTFMFNSCQKQEDYDLFPLILGNEFYYTYSKYRFTGISAYTNGTETWKVTSVLEEDRSVNYRIERILNATIKVAGQTIVISDSISYLTIIEDKSSSLLSFSSSLSIWKISFKRFQDDNIYELKQEGNSSTTRWSFRFKADSGMTHFTYYHPPNQITNESLTLDSLKIIN